MRTATPSLQSVVPLGVEIPWNELHRDRRSFQREFVRLLAAEPGLARKVLDIGCGSALPSALQPLAGRFGSLDGVDPGAAVHRHPLLDQHWRMPFEESPIPEDTYDLAYAYNVLEHIAHPAPFLRKVHSVLKPGGVFLGLTPNGAHPFALLSRSIEKIGLKSYARRKIGRSEETGEMAVNDYPAYYRCNTPGSVNRAMANLSFRRATYYYFPCLQWDTYFPKALRWAPHCYDFLAGTRWSRCMQIFIVRLEK